MREHITTQLISPSRSYSTTRLRLGVYVLRNNKYDEELLSSDVTHFPSDQRCFYNLCNFQNKHSSFLNGSINHDRIKKARKQMS